VVGSISSSVAAPIARPFSGILELRFGFEGEPWTLEAIGHELDLTRERVRQLEGQALARLAAIRDLSSVAAA
jgi:DNA-directed RNA polymerase sigma subunit (sigma70/sigma32)